MTTDKIKLPYLQIIDNPSGVPYAYIRFCGKRHAIKSLSGDFLLPGDDGFFTAYETTAREIGAQKALKALPKRQVEKGSISRLVAGYRASGDYSELSDGYRADKDYYLDFIDLKYGTKPVWRMEYEHALDVRDQFSETPGKANNLVKHFRGLIDWGMVRREFKMPAGVNPFDKVKRLKIGEVEPWPDGLFERAIEIADPMMRLSYFLFLYTGQRISDVAKMRRNVVKNDQIRVRQQKTKKWLWCPCILCCGTSWRPRPRIRCFWSAIGSDNNLPGTPSGRGI